MKYSKLESEILNYKVGRIALKESETALMDLQEEIYNNRFDICRIKLYANNRTLFQYLGELNCPIHIYNINYWNVLKIPEPTPFDKKDFSIRQVQDNASDLEFQNLLKQVLQSKTWMEYEGHLSSGVFSSAIKQELAFDYYKNFNIHSNPAAYTGILYKGNSAIGLFMGEFENRTFAGSLFGILQEYRSLGYAKYFYEFMFEQCRLRNIEFFETEVNLFNFGSQQSALSKKFVTKSIHFNLTIFPFLSLTRNQVKGLFLNEFSLTSILGHFEREYKWSKNWSIKTKEYKNTTRAINEAKYQVVLENQKYIFIVVHLLEDEHLSKIIYIEITKT
jgi:hypothetical protein